MAGGVGVVLWRAAVAVVTDVCAVRHDVFHVDVFFKIGGLRGNTVYMQWVLLP